MPAITCFDPAGGQHEFEGQLGELAMKTAVKNRVPGIVGNSGIFPPRTSCHIYVMDEWIDGIRRVDDADGTTRHLIADDTAAESQLGSRLSRQVKLTEHLSGLGVEIPSERV